MIMMMTAVFFCFAVPFSFKRAWVAEDESKTDGSDHDGRRATATSCIFSRLLRAQKACSRWLISDHGALMTGDNHDQKCLLGKGGESEDQHRDMLPHLRANTT
ncbi:hypothetical protein B0T10DRAFT_97777 [Thelonectria olida]|uniref:Secreted protein n=1 Tax=Thelonectria olida TaxID=1576542 RepID=A0A9P9AMF9_9HYPO|nr:hypothetical protein B0T10DRAFT_97777 [Thelonectria olida]